MAGKRKWIKPPADEKSPTEDKLENPPLGKASGEGPAPVGDAKPHRSAKQKRSILYGDK